MEKIIQKHEDKVIFYVCLVVAILLLATSFLLPPTGVIDPSILKAVAELLGFAALAIVGKNLAMGKEVTFHHGQTEVKIGDDENE
jgi:hypothetical protein